MMGEVASDDVFVQVVDVSSGQEIAWHEPFAEKLSDRLADVRTRDRGGFGDRRSEPAEVDATEGWRLAEVSASFGVTLSAEASILVSKASGSSTFEISVSFRPNT